MNNIKRIWAAVIVFCMLFTLIPMAAAAEDEMSGKCGKNLTWEFDSETKTLTISGTGDMAVYFQNPTNFYSMAPWRENEAINNNLEKVIIEEGAADIGQYAFYECPALKEVTLPESVKKIGSYAFYRCTELEKINIDKVTEIYFGAFSNCTSLDGITLADGITAIMTDTFFNCSSLTKINVPASLTWIDPMGILPGCTALTEFIVDEGNETYASEDGVLFNKAKTALYKFPTGKSLEGYTMSESVDRVISGAFSEYSKNKSANYEDGLLIVGKWIVDAKKGDVAGDYEINVPENVTNIADAVFNSCEKLKSIFVPESITSIGRNAFNAESLESISVSAENANYSSEDGVLYNKDKTVLIRYPAAKGDASFTTPQSVATIEEYAFDENKKLSGIRLSGVKQILWGGFSYTGIKDVTFSSDIEEVGEFAFFEANGLENVYYAGDEESWKNVTVNDIYEANTPFVTKEVIFVSADKPDIKVNGTYVYNGTEQTAELSGFDPVFMTISGTVATDAGTYEITVLPKTKWSDGTTDGVTASWTVAKAKPEGKPNYKKITSAGKTLADADLNAEAGAFNTEGNVTWVQEDGTALAASTVVAANKYYKWLFTPSDTDNYETLTGTIKLYSKSSGGGGGGAPRYSISFETNGGSKVESQSVIKNNTVKEPAAPTREGFDFAGWYSDKALKEEYDFSEKVTGRLTLYAAWEEKDETENQMILTIGEKAAKVFGKTKSNDVAPVIKNSRTMLPARFVAENLGAKVSWDEEKGLVTVTGKDVTILLTIDSDKATVNGKEVSLDSPAFIENDRTYTPVRFIAEALGAKVEWLEKEQKVIITKA